MSTDPTQSMLALIDASPTPFHAVATVSSQLEAAGYSRLEEGAAWSLQAGSKHFVTRNGSTLVAFEVGTEPSAEAGFRVVGAHTDSPNLRLKPHPAYVKEGYRQLGVEVYGGVLLATWADRDLGLAGRVCVKGAVAPSLVRIDRPLARVANLAIHLHDDVNGKGLKLDKQNHLPPLVGLESDPEDPNWFQTFLALEVGCEADEIETFDLMFHHLMPSTVGGVHGEFVFAPRLDNLASCHAGLAALLSAGERGPGVATRGIALYDNEEVGSQSAEGAGSPFLASVLERITLATGDGREDLHRALANSFFVSADMAHAVHPNYSDRHEPRHMPRINAGPVIKVNSNLRYATNADTASRFERAAKEVEVSVQRFTNRTDLRCGSTIGPITAAKLGMPTVDVGNPMLSMHSAREMAGSKDQGAMIRVLAKLFE